jgi:hypothetical protein
MPMTIRLNDSMYIKVYRHEETMYHTLIVSQDRKSFVMTSFVFINNDFMMIASMKHSSHDALLLRF